MRKSTYLIAGLLLAAASTGWAVPYASGVSVAGSTVSFTLNEAADMVSVQYNGGTGVQYLGPLGAGTQSFDATGYADWKIRVQKSTAPGWTQISNDALTQSKYYSPRGVAVNRDSASGLFGNIYAAEGLGGAVAAGGRTTTDGIYVMGADQSDILGQGDTAFAGGIDWATGGSSSPFKLGIGPDGMVYISDWSDGHSGMWTADPNSMTTPFVELLSNVGRDAAGLVQVGAVDLHGSIPSGAWVEGTGANRKLYTVDEDVRRGSILRYDLGTTTSGYATPPTDQTSDASGYILNGLMDVVRDDDGSWWIAQYRYTDSNAVPALSHWQDGADAPDWTSGPSTVDLSRGYGELDIDDTGNLLALGANNGSIYVLDISGATPSLAATIAHSGNTVRDVAFDAAGNIYAVSSSSETMRIYSPGGTTDRVTGSDGSFSLVPEPATMVLLGLGGLAALLRRRR